jgi:hypothetical protein
MNDLDRLKQLMQAYRKIKVELNELIQLYNLGWNNRLDLGDPLLSAADEVVLMLEKFVARSANAKGSVRINGIKLGSQREVLLLVQDGNWPPPEMTQRLRMARLHAIRFGLLKTDPSGEGGVVLTSAGRDRLKWFEDHPTKISYIGQWRDGRWHNKREKGSNQDE